MKVYLNTWMQLIKAPRTFFSAYDDQLRQLSPVLFLAVSSVISALSAMLLGSHSGNVIKGAIMLVNGFGMATLASIIAYVVVVPVAGKGVPFGRLFGVFAHSSGVTLLFSWIPALVLITEPWRWWLIWTGMRRGCGLTRGQAAIVLTLSFTMIVMLFWILLPLTAPSGADGL